MVSYTKSSSYGNGEGKYSDKGIDLRSAPYFESLRSFEVIYSGRSLYERNIREDYSVSNYA